MRVFDFDKTIYRKDSTLEFYLYCVKKNYKAGKILPKFLGKAIMYKLGRVSKTEMKTAFFSYLIEMDNIEALVETFWRDRSLMNWYIKDIRESDVIISASPEFLIKPMMIKYGIEKVLASEVDMNSGQFASPNCYGSEKVIRFQNSGYVGEIHEFYSDSLSDSPMAELADKAYLVCDGNYTKW